MLDWTGEERWARAWRESADELWRRRYRDGFWTYPPYGKAPGAAHGIGTNTNVLLQGGELLPADRQERLQTETAAALSSVAVREDGLANWPMSVEDCGELEWQGQIRLQWCHGGAGVVASASPYLDEELLLAGAELVWRAGPASMAKGPRDLPRDGRERLRTPTHVRANRQRALARAGATVRRSRARPGRARAGATGPRPLLAVDR